MQIIGLIGYVDKYDFIMNMAKVLEVMDKSVLVIDATRDKKLKYIVPAIDASADAYISKYSDIDFAVGFNKLKELEDYMIEHEVEFEKYDYVLFDIDSAETYKNFKGKDFNRKYMFIDSGVVSVAKNKELVKVMQKDIQESNIKFTKVIYKAYLSRASEEYLENQIALYGVDWHEESYEIMIDDQDKIVDIDSQFCGNIQIRKHTRLYLYVMSEIIAKLLDEDPKNIIKQIKRRKD